jgi:hypothetical protein
MAVTAKNSSRYSKYRKTSSSRLMTLRFGRRSLTIFESSG